MNKYYDFTKNIADLYRLFEDEQSRKVFWIRIKYDITGKSFDNMLEFSLLNEMFVNATTGEKVHWKEHFEKLHSDNKKIILYGAGAWGKCYGKEIENAGEFFDAFCDAKFETFTDGYMGKPVLSPQYIFDHPQDCYVMITTMFFADEIFDYLVDNGFPQSHILPYFYKAGASMSELIDKQYFEFPELFPIGTAFVDAGCYDGATSLRFSNWCNGEYTKIFAFEPDHRNYLRCNEIAQNNPELRMDVIEAGVGAESGIAEFMLDESSSCSHIVKNGTDLSQTTESMMQSIQIVSIDDVVGEETVGFIKMDIEGAEYSALEGSKNIIVRDKPLCAICVYHEAGDVLAIMDYLHELVPEYRFWLRHYSSANSETILYASL